MSGVDGVDGVEGGEGGEGGDVVDAFNEGVKGFKSVAVLLADDKLAEDRLADDGLAFVVASYGHDLAFMSCTFIVFAARSSLARIAAKSMPFDLALTRTSVKIRFVWAVSLDRSSFPRVHHHDEEDDDPGTHQPLGPLGVAVCHGH